MFTIIFFWFESLKLFTVAHFFSFLIQAWHCFLHASVALVTTLRWFFVADLIIFTLAGNHLIAALCQTEKMPLEASGGVFLFYFVTNVIWFIIATASLLFIRWQHRDESALAYLKYYFFRFIQLAFFFALLLFLLLTMLMLFGITKIPTPHWSFLLLVRLIELVAFFYWLDSSFSLKDAMKSLEKSINFVVYNFPICILIFIALWLSQAVLKGLLWGWSHAFLVDQALLSGKIEYLVKNKEVCEQISVTRFLMLKYGKFFIECFWMSVIFVFYDTKKQISYAKSFFE